MAVKRCLCVGKFVCVCVRVAYYETRKTPITSGTESECGEQRCSEGGRERAMQVKRQGESDLQLQKR